jgi:hypothetical protein
MSIQVKSGSATNLEPHVILGHVCNSAGGWGAGFVLSVNNISSVPKAAYKALYQDNQLSLGFTQFVEIKPTIFVANMIAQDGYARNHADGCALDYEALKSCLKTLFARAIKLGYKVYFPAGMGSTLAGGKRETVHEIIKETAELIEQKFGGELDVTLWEFDPKTEDTK